METVTTILDKVMQDGKWSIEWTEAYAEPGYEAPKRGILFANWNNEQRRGTEDERHDGKYWIDVSNFRSRFGDLCERAGYDCEWSDEWGICGDCNRAIRTEPDCFDWRPSFMIVDSDYLCAECWADLSIQDRMVACRDAGLSIFAARSESIPRW